MNLENWVFKKEDNLVTGNNLNLRKKENNNDLADEKSAYFVGQLMYRLNYLIDEDKNNPIYQEQNKILYREMHMDFMESYLSCSNRKNNKF